MKKRLKEMEEEAAALREMQAKVEKEMGAVQGSSSLFLAVSFCFFFLFSDHLIVSIELVVKCVVFNILSERCIVCLL